jgi:hypothetical protein
VSTRPIQSRDIGPGPQWPWHFACARVCVLVYVHTPSTLRMGIVSSRDPREEEKRAEMQAKARSNAIDLSIEADSNLLKRGREHNVLLISSCPHLCDVSSATSHRPF